MRVLLFTVLLFSALSGYTQSRIYLAGGLTTSIGGSADTFTATTTTLPSFDLELEKKIVGSMSLLTGASLFGVGYSYDGTGFAANSSSFKANYAAIPLMARWNMFNKNKFYFDFGILTSYLVNARLKETYPKFSVPQTAEGDIAAYSNRLLVSAKFQETFAINRFSISLFFIVTFKGQSTVKNLEDHWPLNRQQSTYLLSNGYSDFTVFGLKLGVRIK